MAIYCVGIYNEDSSMINDQVTAQKWVNSVGDM
jgi:hypothetical protein